MGVLADCANISGTLERHAAQLLSAGVDFVVADMSNLYMQGAFADALQQRPFEVLLEEWAALRARGVATPQVAPWPRLPTGANLWEMLVPLYANESYADLWLRSDAGQPVMFLVGEPDGSPGAPDPAVVAQVISACVYLCV